MTIKSFAESDFHFFNESVQNKLDNLADMISALSKDMKNLQNDFNDYKKLKCKCI